MQTITEDKRTYADKMMKRFKLVDMREQYSDIIAEAESEQLDYMDFLVRLLSVEEEGKNARRQEMLLEKANFDRFSSLSEIDYSFNHSLDKDKIEELGKLHFLQKQENIIIIGPPGVGKSMIAKMICKKLQQSVWLKFCKALWQSNDQFSCLNTFSFCSAFFKFFLITLCKFSPEFPFCGFINCIEIFLFCMTGYISDSAFNIA